jgi:subtilisin family serine protease
MSKRMRFVGAMALLVALAGSLFAVLTSRASAQGQAATQSVIVVFNNQDSAAPATRADIATRRSSFQSTQSPVIAQMQAAGATGIQTYSIIDAVSATVPSSEVAALQANPAVQSVVPNQLVPISPPSASSATGTATATPNATGPGADVLARRSTNAVGAHSARPRETAGTGALCSSSPSDPQLNPEALSLIHANSQVPGAQTAASLGFTGAGVKVAFIADGLDIDNPDFIRADGQHVFIDYKDFTGEGTNTVTGGEEAFGDAGSIAAQGREVYNVAGFGPLATTKPCYIRIEGVAPGASLVGLDIFGANNAGYSSTILDAINYAVTTDHVNVLNESFGSNNYPDDVATLDLIKLANDDAVAAGTTVTVSSGDAGSTSTLGSPATDPEVISAGATTSYRIDLQDGYGGAQFPGITGYLDNDISSFSSGGYDQQGQTVDVVAPGELNWSLCSKDVAIYEDCSNYNGQPTNFLPFGGTSESAPLTAGVAALVDQAYDKTHGTYPTPAVVKQIITSTADDIDSPGDQQGAGLIDAYKAVLAAESYKGPASAPAPVGQSLLKSDNQLNIVDQPNTPETVTDTVTNGGAETEHVAVSARTLGAYQSLDASASTVTLSDASSPKTENALGVPANYEPITFQVPAGENRLNAAAAFQSGQTNNTDPPLLARVRITLVDPQGNLAGYSVPQGDGNYGDLQVTNPTPGTWTAYVWSGEGADGGTQGPVQFGASVAQYETFGSVTPASLTLKPGQSAPVTLSFTTPTTPGDEAASLVFAGIGRSAWTLGTSTVPVTVRSLIPSGNESFQQTLTGGNGRQVNVGQEFYYELDVGANQPELNASVALADNPNNPFTAFLVGPNGEAQAVAANALPNGGANPGITNVMGAQLHVLDPAQGAWTLVIAFAPTVSGTTLSEPFTVSTNESQVPVSTSSGSLPDSTSTQLVPGKATTVDVDVTNTGPSPEEYFLDGRLSTTTQLPLTSIDGPSTTVPLTIDQNLPEYLVPTDSTGFTQTATTTGTTPIEFDSESPAGDPDLESTAGLTATSTFSADPLSQGLWDIAPDVTGAYTTTPAPNEPVTTSMTVTTAAFDPAVSSPTGDLWLESTDYPAASQSLSPVIVGPGQSAQIPVTITPKGAAGSTVSGTLYVDDDDSLLFDSYAEPNGNQVAAIPYAYTIK